MKRWLPVSMALLVFVAGCAATRLPTSSPRQVVPVSQGTTSDQIVDDLKRMCEGKLEDVSTTRFADTIQAALLSVPPTDWEETMKSYSVRSTCELHLNTSRNDARDALVMLGKPLDFKVHPTAVIGLVGQQVVVTGLTLGSASEVFYQGRSPAGPEVFILDVTPAGSAWTASVIILRQQGHRWETITQIPAQTNLKADIVDINHLLISGVNNHTHDQGPPLLWPGRKHDYDQSLWSRVQDKFVLTAQRPKPGPDMALNIFFGSLRDGNSEWMERVSTPEAVATAKLLKLDQLVQLHQLDQPSMFTINLTGDVSAVNEAESKRWSALPPELNGEPPSVSTLTGTIDVAVQKSTVTIMDVTLVRAGEQWIVNSIRER